MDTPIRPPLPENSLSDADITGGKNASGKTPRTERGRKTRRKLLDAAAAEFGEKGFHEASVSSITRRAKIALGSFYTYFDSKEELFRALVNDLSGRVKSNTRDTLATFARETGDGENQSPLARELTILAGFLKFAHQHSEMYRIIDEAEFVDPAMYKRHYTSTASRILERLQEGVDLGELRTDIDEVYAWAMMGMNVFLGLRYAVWESDDSLDDVARKANSLLAEGLKRRD